MGNRLVPCLPALLAGLLAGCGGSSDGGGTTPPPPPPAVPASIAVIAGDNQEGSLGDPLPAMVHFRVADNTGHPVPDIDVHLDVSGGGGSVPSELLRTDLRGEVHTLWTLGLQSGQYTLTATTGNLLGAVAAASAAECDLVTCVDDRAAVDPGEWKLLDLATYDGSGQATHPDVVRGRPGSRWYWMTVTPYPNSDITKENPSVFQSHNGHFWKVPKGLLNPVAAPTVGYLSDPDMVYDVPTQEFWMYYRQVTGENIIWLVRSGDGVKWDTPVQVLSAPNHQIVSPSVVHNAPHAPWIMFAANTHIGGCTSTLTTMDRRTSTDGITWSAPQNTDLVQPGQTIWHLDVEWVPARAEYWAIYNTYPAGFSCVTNAIYFARSNDGMHWQTYPSPVLRKGLVDAFRDVVYRSSMIVNANADTVQLFVSGAKFENGYLWHTATITRRVDELFAQLDQPPPASRPSDLPRRGLPPPEPDVGPSIPGGDHPVTPPPVRRIHH